MSFIADRILTLLDTALGRKVSNNIDAINRIRLIKKMEEELAENFTKKYSDYPFFNDLDEFLCYNNSIRNLIESCLYPLNDKAMNENPAALCGRFLSGKPEYLAYKSIVLACIGELHNVAFHALNDNQYSEETRIITMYLTEYNNRIAQKINRGFEETGEKLNRLISQSHERQNHHIDFVITKATDTTPTIHFMGRDKEFEALKNHIVRQKKLMLVSGMGGIGKTQLCRYLYADYINRHKNNEEIEIDHIGYLNYRGTMDETVYNGAAYQRAGNYEIDLQNAWSLLYDISNNHRLLLFIDNVTRRVYEDKTLEKLYRLQGTVVLTSRFTDFDDFELLNLDVMEYRDCKMIFVKIYGAVSAEDSSELEYIICDLVARHTLTVSLLASMAKNKGWSVHILKQRLENNGFKIEFKMGGNKTMLQREYEKLFDMANLSDSEKNVLEAFSIFPYLPLGIQACNDWLNKDAGVTEDDEIFNTLQQKGWLQREGNGGYMLHPVIAAVILEKQKAEAKRHSGLIDGCIAHISINTGEIFTKASPYIPFAEKIAERFYVDNRSELSYDLYYHIGKYHELAGNYEQAKRFLEISYQIIEEETSPAHFKTCALLAGLYENLGDNHTASEYIEISMRSWGSLRDEDTLLLLDLLQTYAYIDENLGRYEAAKEKLHDIIISLQTSNEPIDKDEIRKRESKAYCSLGNLRCNQGDYVEALVFYEKSLALSESMLVKDNLLIQQIYGNMANSYLQTGNLEIAKDFCAKQFRQLADIIYNKKHIMFSYYYDTMGIILYTQGQYEEAIANFENAAQILDRNIYHTHELAARIYNHYGFAAIGKGDYDMALTQFDNALNRVEHSGFDPKEFQKRDDLVTALFGKGLTYEKKEDIINSRKYLTESKKIGESASFRKTQELYRIACAKLEDLSGK